ncbi:hypothetical protein Strvi_2605 [Streptomyces violaceusniger Tu 4113]|uniref:Chitin-binding type-2 domain-containing protein n=1 Tax=Streptomyces violaceusniger (strain Tu 4113) TaxID=653045 RepID=G2PDM1_STRV4|nr:hypothetical protein Strvi_2605 [Streptomyces violaceusniger Tu 4113]
MRLRHALASAGLGTAVAVGTMVVPAQAASTTTTAVRSPAAACTEWFDNAGSGGAERFHVQCPGYYVTVSVTCSSGSPINGPKRWEYQKAECRNGAYITSGSYRATRT